MSSWGLLPAEADGEDEDNIMTADTTDVESVSRQRGNHIKSATIFMLSKTSQLHKFHGYYIHERQSCQINNNIQLSKTSQLHNLPDVTIHEPAPPVLSWPKVSDEAAAKEQRHAVRRTTYCTATPTLPLTHARPATHLS